MKRHFTKFKVYKDTKKIVAEIFLTTREFNRTHWSLADQMNRSVVSVALNIAEGSAKSSDKDFNRYILNALGSATELLAAVDIAREVNLIDQNVFEKLSLEIQEIIQQLGGFSKYLKQAKENK